MTEEQLDARLAELRQLDARLEQDLAEARERAAAGSAGVPDREVDRLIDERAKLLQEITKRAAALGDDRDNPRPRGSGPRPAG